MVDAFCQQGFQLLAQGIQYSFVSSMGLTSGILNILDDRAEFTSGLMGWDDFFPAEGTEYSSVPNRASAFCTFHTNMSPRLKDLDAPAIIKLLYNKDVCKCSSCGGDIIPLPSGRYYIRPEPHLLC